MKAWKQAAVVAAICAGILVSPWIAQQIQKGQLPPNDQGAGGTSTTIPQFSTAAEVVDYFVSRGGLNTVYRVSLSFAPFSPADVGGNCAISPTSSYGVPGYFVSLMTTGAAASGMVGQAIQDGCAYVDGMRAVYWDGNAWSYGCYSTTWGA